MRDAIREGGPMSADQSNLTAFDAEAAPENACVRYEVCENIVPGNGQMCGDCLDELRAADREERGDGR
jgi:hypothetical protein